MNLALFKKYLVLEICGAVILAALIAIGVKLGMAMRQYAGEKGALQAVIDRKDQLDRRSPYPSGENVRQEAENFKDILDSYSELNERLRATQIEPQRMQPADFMPLLENTLRQLRKELIAAHVIYPPQFTFGFERYAGGKLPAAGDIPRLVQQLKITETLCQGLGKAGVAELVLISREEFELAGRSGEPGARGMPPPPTSSARLAEEEPLYTTQHFKLTVKANEAAVIDLLNLLARFPLFTVVTSVEMTNLQDGGAGGGGAPAVSGAALTSPPADRERKLVLGKERVELKLELDVYQFAPSLDFRENVKK